MNGQRSPSAGVFFCRAEGFFIWVTRNFRNEGVEKDGLKSMMVSNLDLLGKEIVSRKKTGVDEHNIKFLGR